MAIERAFLGWDGPCLPRAVGWLWERLGDPGAGRWDLQGVVVATPGARAGRRLIELLVEHAESRRAVLTPPRLVTAGALAELLYQPQQPSADELTCLLARVAALRAGPTEALDCLTRHIPAADDLRGWLGLAEALAALHATLAADAVAVGEVAGRCTDLPSFTNEQRWQALAVLQNGYERELARLGKGDPHLARFAALERGTLRTDQHIVLIAAADLNRITRRIVEAVGDAGGQVTALVHAPESEAAGFDAMGCLHAEHWLALAESEQGIDLAAARVRVADRPRDQAWEVLRAINGADERTRVDAVTVGLGDETMAAMIERVLELSGLPARAASRGLVSDSRPATLLAAFGRFAASHRLDDFAALLRHPDLHAWLEGQRADRAAVADWLTLLDRYATEHLQGKLTGRWLGDEQRVAPLKAAYGAVRNLLPSSPREGRPLPEWAAPIAQMLAAVYDARPLRRHDETDGAVIRGLQEIGDVLRELARLDPAEALTPPVTIAQAVELVLRQVAGKTIPHEGGSPAVELLGWLELQLDDAPVLAITGVNEGAIPQSVNSDAFLPDSMRRHLGLMDNRRRFARDSYLLAAIVRSRPAVTLIAGRRTAENDPLTPSRLLLTGSADTLVERVRAFYGREREAALAPIALLAPGPKSRFVVPQPELPAQPIDRLRVTGFRDYLYCPYRFYLQHVRRLEVVDDAAVELDGMGFGALVHSVLDDFARDEEAVTWSDAERIEAFLVAQLEARRGAKFGDDAGAVVRLQIEQMKARLAAFARWQALQVAQGWRIVNVEQDWKGTLAVDGEPFTITGRIDRIDRHEGGAWRILDYKTSDKGATPEKAHRRGRGEDCEWIDLQLPLYHAMAGQHGVVGTIELGYVVLPKKLGETGLKPAEWGPDELASALETAHEVIRNIRQGIFWPPREDAGVDEWSAICMDGCMERDVRPGAPVAVGAGP